MTTTNNNNNNNRSASNNTGLSTISSGKEADFIAGSEKNSMSYHSNATTSYKGNINSASSSKKDKKRKKKKYEDILLSTGCSAFIRMVDPRVKRLAGPPVSLCGLIGNAGSSMTGNNNTNNNGGNAGSPYINNNSNNSPGTHLHHLHHRDSTSNAAHNSTPPAIRSFQQDTLHDFLYLMSHFAQEDHGQMSLHFDTSKFRKLRHEFQFKTSVGGGNKKKLGNSSNNHQQGSTNNHTTTEVTNNKHTAAAILERVLDNIGGGIQGVRTYRQAVPDTIEKDTLVQEINNKFYDVLSS